MERLRSVAEENTDQLMARIADDVAEFLGVDPADR
jgi:hypothetical protein